MPVDAALRPEPIVAGARQVVRLKLGEGGHRVRVPERIHPYSSGFWGGLAGGAAMAALACLYGVIAQHSIWFPINLLAGAVMPDLGNASLEQLRALQRYGIRGRVRGSRHHLNIGGVLYAVMLPMFPKYAVVWAGIMMPIVLERRGSHHPGRGESGDERPDQLALVCGGATWIWIGRWLRGRAQHQHPDHAIVDFGGTCISGNAW